MRLPRRHWLVALMLSGITLGAVGLYTLVREAPVALVDSEAATSTPCKVARWSDDPAPIAFGRILDGSNAPLLWHRKDGGGRPMNPGCNHFSRDNVWIDEQSRLHLLLAERDLPTGERVLHAAEIVAAAPLGYGAYEVDVVTDPQDLPINVVFALFTYLEEPAFANREFDIELSRWSERDAPNAQFVSHFISPAGDSGRLRGRFELAGAGLRHKIEWRAGVVEFASGEFSASAERFVPAPGDARFRLNLWRHRGALHRKVEVVVRDITFRPLQVPDG